MNLKLANGCTLNVDIHPGTAPTDVVFVHGNMASNTWWHPTLELWPGTSPAEGLGRLIFIEWRGCGKSSAPQSSGELHPASLANDIVLALRELGVSQAHLVGHSTGGLISLYALLQAPELFQRAVLLDSVGAEGLQFEDRVLEAYSRMKGDRRFCELVISGTIHRCDLHSPLFQQIVDDAMGTAALNWSGVVSELRKIDVRVDLARITHPILILHGEYDSVLPIASSHTLSQLLPNARFQELKDQGHSTNVENPRLFASLVKEFLFQT